MKVYSFISAAFLVLAGFPVKVPASDYPRLDRLLQEGTTVAAGESMLELAHRIALIDRHLNPQTLTRWQPCRVAVSSEGRHAQAAILSQRLHHLLNTKVEKDIDALKEVLRRYQQKKIRLSDLEIDALLGIEFWRFEKQIDPQRYPALDIYQAVELAQTSYGQIADFYDDSSPQAGDVIWEPGAMYAKLLIFGALLHDEVRFKGVELVKERVDQVATIKERLRLTNLAITAGDMFEMNYEDGTWFYINLLKSNGLSGLLERLAPIGRKKVITLTSLNGPTEELLKTGDFVLWNDRYVRSLPRPE